MLACVLFTVPGFSQELARPAPRILLLHPSDLLLPGTIEQDAITRKALSDALPPPLEFYSVGFDDLRSLGASVEDDLVALLLKKFGERPPDLVVLHGPMHELFKRNRARLWPGAPIMFVGVAGHRLDDPALPEDVPIISANFDLPGTVELALRLQPAARRLLLITGSASYDRMWQALALPQLQKFRNRLAIESTSGQSLVELEARLASVGPETIVFYLSMFRDNSQRIYFQRDVIAVLAARSRVPIFITHQIGVNEGWGPLGGSVVNWNGQHDAIGDIARRLIAGESSADILSPAPVPAVCRIDWRRLRHWQIPANRVPKNCEILFREQSFWVRYRTQTILIGLIVLLQAAVIALLLRQRHLRRQTLIQAERQRVELSHASRLAMVGELSASIAHEINQPLSAIHMNASVGEEMLESANPRLAELKEILGDIRRDDERASEVIKRLRELLQKRPIEMRQLNINETIRGVLQFLSVSARHREMYIKTELGDGLPAVRGDRVQLQQVVMNLVLNAIEAMAESPPDRRTLTVRTQEQPEGWIEVSVNDAGHGIAPDSLAKVFDPFFTTKREGMGLGLSISRTIVQAHGGRIWAESHGAGATFRFTLPLVTGIGA